MNGEFKTENTFYKEVNINMAGNVPNNPSKAPNAPAGGVPGAKGPSKPMSPMPSAQPTRPGAGSPDGSSSVSPNSQSQTVPGGPKR